MYKIKKFKDEDSFSNAVENISNKEAYAYDATSSYYPVLIKELENDYVVFYDFYPLDKKIKKATKEIEFSNIGEPFFTWCKKRYFLKNFLRINF